MDPYYIPHVVCLLAGGTRRLTHSMRSQQSVSTALLSTLETLVSHFPALTCVTSHLLLSSVAQQGASNTPTKALWSEGAVQECPSPGEGAHENACFLEVSYRKSSAVSRSSVLFALLLPCAVSTTLHLSSCRPARPLFGAAACSRGRASPRLAWRGPCFRRACRRPRSLSGWWHHGACSVKQSHRHRSRRRRFPKALVASSATSPRRRLAGRALPASRRERRRKARRRAAAAVAAAPAAARAAARAAAAAVAARMAPPARALAAARAAAARVESAVASLAATAAPTSRQSRWQSG